MSMSATPFSATSACKQQVVATAQRLAGKGYLLATGGNVSVRIAGGDTFAITPSNFDYAKMVAEDVNLLDLDLRRLEGDRPPSVESGLHAGIYRVRPDVQAIVHTHQVYASTLALLGTPIPALFDEQARFLGRQVPIVPYAPSGTGWLTRKVARHVRGHRNAFIMQNHGVLCLGHDAERAAHNVEILEKCAIAYLLALCTGHKVSKIPMAVREIAVAKLRSDQKKAERGEISTRGE